MSGLPCINPYRISEVSDAFFSPLFWADFTELGRACCGGGDFGEGGCDGAAPLCGNRSSYVFWDRFHPTEAASAVTANELFLDTGLFVRPINVRQLVAPRP